MRFSVRCGLVLMLSGSAVLGSLSPAGGFAGFGDVPEESFYTEAVQWMVDNGITTGTSPECFSPNDAVTRGQAAAFMWRMEGRPAASPHPFNDVNASWQQDPVSWMYEQGITTGTSPVTYSPNETLTRGQLAALLWRLEGEPSAPSHPFNDVVASWQQGPVSWMASASPAITTGTSPSTFSPNDPVTRGQLATFFWRYKGKPAVIVDLTHPADAGCEGQIELPTGSYNGIGVGDCFDFPTDSDSSANRKSCSSAHEGEMFVKDYVPSSFLNPAMPYPTDAEWLEIAYDVCDARFASYTGLTIFDALDEELFSYTYLFTLEQDWWRTDWRSLSCAITQYYDGGTIYGSAYSSAWNEWIFISAYEVVLRLS